MQENILTLRDIVVEFDGERILDKINLSIRDNEFVTLLGPSGCGKTTTLRIIAGFVEPNAGEVLFEGQKINGVPPHMRQVNTVFQRYALFPHLNVFENVAFGLRIKKTPKDELNRRVMEMLELVDLKGFEKRSVQSLSGGQQQRVAIARAVVGKPRMLLLDEPLAALDLKLRKEMQLELKNIQQSLGITFVFVTHDQEEALSMSDTVVVMQDGVIQQIGTPEDIYNEPANAFVADFIGDSNILDGIMKRDFLVSFEGQECACLDRDFAPNERVDVVIRPEDVDIVPTQLGIFTGTVESSLFKGVHYEIVVDVSGYKWYIHTTDNVEIGAQMGLKFGPEDLHIMHKMFDGTTNVLQGEVVGEDEIEFLGVRFTRENLGLPVGAPVRLTFSPYDIIVAPEEDRDATVYVESVIYKGRFSELIVWKDETQLILRTQRDEQVATDIGVDFNFDHIKIEPLGEKADA